MLKNTQFYMTDIKIHRRNFPTVNLVIYTIFVFTRCGTGMSPPGREYRWYDRTGQA